MRPPIPQLSRKPTSISDKFSHLLFRMSLKTTGWLAASQYACVELVLLQSPIFNPLTPGSGSDSYSQNFLLSSRRFTSAGYKNAMRVLENAVERFSGEGMVGDLLSAMACGTAAAELACTEMPLLGLTPHK